MSCLERGETGRREQWWFARFHSQVRVIIFAARRVYHFVLSGKKFSVATPKKDNTMAEASRSIPVIRRQELFFGGGVRESLNESALDTFRLKVPANIATLDKMTFDFRSPASGLLCHPLAWLEAKFTVKVPGNVSQATQYSAGICQDNLDAAR